jgi:hypothetical protein
MSDPRLPSEMLDHIVDYLHDTEDALKNCCLVPNSGSPRTRKHLFVNLTFPSADGIQPRKDMFPNPSASSACYIKSIRWLLRGRHGCRRGERLDRRIFLRRTPDIGQSGNCPAARPLSHNLTDFHPPLYPSTWTSPSFRPHRSSTSFFHSHFSRIRLWSVPTMCRLTVKTIPMGCRSPPSSRAHPSLPGSLSFT